MIEYILTCNIIHLRIICYIYLERLFVSNFTVKTRKYYFYTHRISMETMILSAKFDSKYQNRLTNDLIMADYYTHYYTHLWEANNRVSSHKSIVDPLLRKAILIVTTHFPRRVHATS